MPSARRRLMSQTRNDEGNFSIISFSWKTYYILLHFAEVEATDFQSIDLDS